MWELRWALLGLGILLIAGVYFWGRGDLSRLRFRFGGVRPEKPTNPPETSTAGTTPAHSDAPEEQASAEPPKTQPKPRASTERIITIRFVPIDGELNADTVVLALRAAGLRHGRYGIFHRIDQALADEPLFSVANLTEPGSFDLQNLAESKIPGMSFFMILPGMGDPVERFDLMVQMARALAHELNGELHDDSGSSWSIQRERYVREEIIEYRHQRQRH